MPRKKLILIALSVLILLTSFVSSLYASDYQGTVDITCTNFTAAGTGAHILDRDTTGTGQEQIRIDVTDGAGTLIYTFSYSNFLGNYAGGMIGTTPYNTAPQYNPITVKVISLAGNGFPEQVQTFQGSCAGLPTFVAPQEPGLIVPNLGMVVIYRSQAQPVYMSPAGQVIRDGSGNEIWLPNDSNFDDFDTYVVTDVKAVDGRVWVGIFLGSDKWGWVPLDSVTPATYLGEENLLGDDSAD
jgi:hypothetical protein